MSDALRIAFGLCGLIGGTAGLVGAYLAWKTRGAIRDMRNRLNLHESP